MNNIPFDQHRSLCKIWELHYDGSTYQHHCGHAVGSSECAFLKCLQWCLKFLHQSLCSLYECCTSCVCRAMRLVAAITWRRRAWLGVWHFWRRVELTLTALSQIVILKFRSSSGRITSTITMMSGTLQKVSSLLPTAFPFWILFDSFGEKDLINFVCIKSWCVLQYVLVVYLSAFYFSAGFSKKLESIGKQRDCEKLKRWTKGMNNHVYFTAIGSTSGAERVAKWTAMLDHVQDIHTHEDPFYPACEHAIRQTRDPTKYLQAGIHPTLINMPQVKSLN